MASSEERGENGDKVDVIRGTGFTRAGCHDHSDDPEMWVSEESGMVWPT